MRGQVDKYWSERIKSQAALYSTPIHESSAFLMFIFYVYMLLFMFLLFFGTRMHIYKQQLSINGCMRRSNLLDYAVFQRSLHVDDYYPGKIHPSIQSVTGVRDVPRVCVKAKLITGAFTSYKKIEWPSIRLKSAQC